VRAAAVLGERDRQDAVGAVEPPRRGDADEVVVLAGLRIETPVSVASPASARLAATATAVPALDPPGTRSGSYALRVWPPSELRPLEPRASSSRFVFASTIAPASRRRSTIVASSGGTEPSKAIDPPVVGMSNVS